jgi:hypothetical protein
MERKYLEDIKRPNLFSRIKLWWNHEGRYYPKNFITGVKNLKDWLPVIWKDRDWDDHYILEVLKFKLEKQSKYISEKNRYIDAQLGAKRMRLCVSLIDKVQNEFYQMEYMDYVKDKHWFEKSEDNSDHYTLESELEWEKFDDYIKKYPLIHKRVLKDKGRFKLKGKKDLDLKRTICMNISHINGERAHKLLFKILEENIRKWWD